MVWPDVTVHVVSAEIIHRSLIRILICIVCKYIYTHVCMYIYIYSTYVWCKDVWCRFARLDDSTVVPVFVKKHSFCASPCPATQQQKLLSSPWFGAPKTDVPMSCLFPNSVFHRHRYHPVYNTRRWLPRIAIDCVALCYAHRWNRNPQPQPQKFGKLVHLISSN